MDSGLPDSRDDLFERAPTPAIGTLEDILVVEDDTDLSDHDSGIGEEPEGELQVPLASQEVALDQEEFIRQARAALKNSRE
jgi:hypothetical protein